GPLALAVQAELDHLVSPGSCAVNVLNSILVAEFQTMYPLRAGSAEKLALGRENHNPSLAISGDINVPCFVDDGSAMAGSKNLPAWVLLEETRRDRIFHFFCVSQRRSE